MKTRNLGNTGDVFGLEALDARCLLSAECAPAAAAASSVVVADADFLNGESQDGAVAGPDDHGDTVENTYSEDDLGGVWGSQTSEWDGDDRGYIPGDVVRMTPADVLSQTDADVADAIVEDVRSVAPLMGEIDFSFAMAEMMSSKGQWISTDGSLNTSVIGSGNSGNIGLMNLNGVAAQHVTIASTFVKAQNR